MKILSVLVLLGFMGCALDLSRDISGLWVNDQIGHYFNNGFIVKTTIDPLTNKIKHFKYSYALDSKTIYLNGSIFAKIELITDSELILIAHKDDSLIHLFKQNI